jgi:hypothetical protein
MYKRTFMQTLAAVAMMLLPAACADDYDDSALWDKVNDHEERIAALEKWQEQTNQSIAAMQELLNTTDMITGVSAVSEGGQTVGYTITFLHSDPITIYNGAKGADGEDGADGADGQTPQIGLAQAEDGNWYWTLNGETLTDADGNPIRANGLDGADGEDGEDGATGPEGPQGDDGTSAPTPQIKLGSNVTGTIMTDNGQTIADAWYLSVDGGATWYRVSGTDGTNGDTWFAKAPEKVGNYYLFTLADQSTFRVAAYQPFRILAKGETLESFDNATVPVNEATTLYLSIDEGIEYSSIVAQATPVDGDAVLTRADGWSAKVAKSGEDITVTVTPPTQAGYALLDVSLLLTDGSKLTASRLLTKGYSYDNNTYTVYTADGLLVWNEAAQNDLSTNCILAADITLPTVAEGESNWTPIGTNDHYYSRYTGTFDGGGHTITGLTINQSGTDYVGLFGCIGGRGTVKNLTLENVNITGHDNVGGVVGSTDDYLNIVTGCTVTGTVSGNSNVGGVVGYNHAGDVIGCTASGDVTGMGNNVGGVVGENFSSGDVTACYHASGSVSGANFVGGLVGYTDFMTACYNASGDVTSKGDFVGSVAGYNSRIITACYWSNYDGNGIGINDGTGTPTKVDGTTVTWQTAVDAMNAALQNINSEWRYELTGALPTLKKQ